jgi:ferredoxin
MPKVHFLNEIITVEARAGQTIKEVAKEHGIPLHRGLWTWANCRSLGLCGSCQVWVNPLAPNALAEKTFFERKRAKVQGTVRLGCQAKVQGDVEVRTMPGGIMFEPPRTTEWEADPRPSKWKERLAKAAAGDDEEEASGEGKVTKPAAPAASAAGAAPAKPAPAPAAPAPAPAPAPTPTPKS